ncbi:unnamed protein product [Toxocara canis]|uniref:Importin N-terminal domain-containing protein n=1 Tax=Toxocara canis TaxID=6265 RepID=A0A183UNM9_TOXCA|nr:unnamed protein product [Toxocara canis]
MSSLLSQLEAADTWASRVAVFEELNALANEAPERIAPFLAHIQNAFIEPLSHLRKIAFQSCAEALLEAASKAASGWPSTELSSDLALALAAAPLDLDDIPTAAK